MARRRFVEEHENHERWLVSYADFITLLFAFFVVMYAVSSVNEGKYRVLTDSLAAGFRGPPKSLVPLQVGDLVRSPAVQRMAVTERRTAPSAEAPLRPRINPMDLPVDPATQPPLPAPSVATAPSTAPGARDTALAEIERDVTQRMEKLLDDELMDIRRTDDWIELEVKQSVVFPRGSATMSTAGSPVLKQIAQVLAPYPNAVQVEGHADSTPIANETFPSNWELSAARAAAIVNFFTGEGLDPKRLAAIGYGQFRPIAENDTAQGRAKNRRVVIVVHAGGTARGAPTGPWAPRGARPAG